MSKPSIEQLDSRVEQVSHFVYVARSLMNSEHLDVACELLGRAMGSAKEIEKIAGVIRNRDHCHRWLRIPDRFYDAVSEHVGDHCPISITQVVYDILKGYHKGRGLGERVMDMKKIFCD